MTYGSQVRKFALERRLVAQCRKFSIVIVSIAGGPGVRVGFDRSHFDLPDQTRLVICKMALRPGALKRPEVNQEQTYHSG